MIARIEPGVVDLPPAGEPGDVMAEYAAAVAPVRRAREEHPVVHRERRDILVVAVAEAGAV